MCHLISAEIGDTDPAEEDETAKDYQRSYCFPKDEPGEKDGKEWYKIDEYS